MTRRSPYDDIDPIQRWSTTAAAIANGTLDPQGPVKFSIAPTDRIVSAGSCFATRIAEHLRAVSAHYLVAEPAPAWLSAEEANAYGYAPFSARYGLVFSTLQLGQLFDRAFGRFTPLERAWSHEGGYVDPFRPRITPEPFRSVAELEADRASHFSAVRRMFGLADVFVFTLGLTEIWSDRRDGSVYPICPGIAGGTFDPAVHEFRNLGFVENFQALEHFLESVREVNSKIKVILTVSPVPLGATIERQHVVRATTYSKSVLRAVAEEIARKYEFVDYFAAYEMVAQSCTGDDAFERVRRHVRTDHALRVVEAFCKSYLRGTELIRPSGSEANPQIPDPRACDEDLFAR